MNFFINEAWAEGAGSPATAGLDFFIFMAILFGIFYFMIIRPQSKKAKEHKRMLEALGKGDEVVTNGGVLGRVTELGDNFLTLEIAKGVEIKVQRHAIGVVMPKGTIKHA